MKNTSKWTHERRIAMGVLGRLAVEGALAENTLFSGNDNNMERLIDLIGDGIRADLDELGVGVSLNEITLAADVGRLYMPEHAERRAQ